ncbi:MAG: Uma2 family endonuclease [Acidobacteria bacterium]|nr:Uma2 family endonuclease [Acidobacteriota bacterium]MCI0717625.1 Uma2 family endonuclease [Acidobacteriota bacterium]
MTTHRQPSRHYSVEEYFSLEGASEIKHEFHQGQIFAMVGASRNHNRIAGNVFAALRAALRGSTCEAFTSDMRLQTPSGLYTYPDVMVVCGPIVLSGDRLETATNPGVLVEVLSESTREYDQNEKMSLYRLIPTLRDYVLIEQAMVKVDHWRLESSRQWTLRQHLSENERLQLSAVPFRMPVSEIYERVQFVP